MKKEDTPFEASLKASLKAQPMPVEASVPVEDSAAAPIVAARWHVMTERVAAQAKVWGRDPQSVGVLVATKGAKLARLTAMMDAGARQIGENRVHEAQAKWEATSDDARARWPGLCLHMIGRLQRNKAREAAALFDVLHTLDSVRLAEALARGCDVLGERARLRRVFVQVSMDGDPLRGGVGVGEAAALCARAAGLGFEVAGLMTLPPLGEPSACAFAALAALAADLGLAELSMGMSADAMEAVALGARWVRIGSAIVGAVRAPA